ncbi:WD repeat-containing and planar cell polarity effector protein fritz, partial [Eumeta japonica]
MTEFSAACFSQAAAILMKMKELMAILARPVNFVRNRLVLNPQYQKMQAAPQPQLNANGFSSAPQWADLNVSLKTAPLKTAFTHHHHHNANNKPAKSNPPAPPSHTLNNNLPLPSTSLVSTPLSYLASPIIISDAHSSLAPQRTYQQPPAPIVPNNSYQPKFFQHPLVSGNIPSTGITSLAPYSISNEEYQKVLLSKKPTASILSNGSATQNGSNTSVLSNNSAQNGFKDGSKHASGEKIRSSFQIPFRWLLYR